MIRTCIRTTMVTCRMSTLQLHHMASMHSCTAIALAPSVQSSPIHVTPSSVRPLRTGQFRVVLREVDAIDLTILSAATAPLSKPVTLSSFQSMLNKTIHPPPMPSTIPAYQTKEDAPVEPMRTTIHVPQNRVLNWIRNKFGMHLFAQAKRVFQSIQHQAGRDEWFTPSPEGLTCAMHRTTMSRVQLEALHLWMVHVRLRSESWNSRELDGKRFVRILFDLYWSEQRNLIGGSNVTGTMMGNSSPNSTATATTVPGHVPEGQTLDQTMTNLAEVIYGGWVAMDKSLIPVLKQREKLDESQHVPPTATFGHARFSPNAVDTALFGALWRNAYLADRSLHPSHIPPLMDYVLRSIEHLYEFTAKEMVEGKFTWFDPPRIIPPPSSSISSHERIKIADYYNLFAPLANEGQYLRTEGVPQIFGESRW